MHDHPQAASIPSFALSDHHVISLAGRDAVAFAQAQFMNDIDAVATGCWQWNGWLTPKGRVVALFALLRIDDEILWLLLPDADPASMVAALQRFVFRSKVTLAVREDLKVSAAFAAPVLAYTIGAECKEWRGGGTAGAAGASAAASTARCTIALSCAESCTR